MSYCFQQSSVFIILILLILPKKYFVIFYFTLYSIDILHNLQKSFFLPVL